MLPRLLIVPAISHNLPLLAAVPGPEVKWQHGLLALQGAAQVGTCLCLARTITSIMLHAAMITTSDTALNVVRLGCGNYCDDD